MRQTPDRTIVDSILEGDVGIIVCDPLGIVDVIARKGNLRDVTSTGERIETRARVAARGISPKIAASQIWLPVESTRPGMLRKGGAKESAHVIAIASIATVDLKMHWLGPRF
eukprot:s1813_g6.t1